MVTKGSQKRIARAVDLLMQLSPKRWITNPVTGKRETHTISFITLTIPAKETHIEASEGHKKALAPWLLKMKRKVGLNTYIWKAEFQANGQLHYHITTPSWIHYQTIKDEWNNILSGAGLLKQWHIDNPGKMPNSTDVHKVYKLNNIQAYLTKYLSKATQDKKTTGKIWDCSSNLKGIKHFSVPISGSFELKQGLYAVNKLENCTMITASEPKELLPDNVKSQYNNFLQDLKANVNV